MSDKKFEVSEGRLVKIVEFVADCMGEVGLKFVKKGLRERVKVSSCWDGEAVFVEMTASGKGKMKPEVWFHVCAGVDDDGDMPDAYILTAFAVCPAPWDSFGRLWSMDREYAFMVFAPGTDEIEDVDWGNEMDDEEDAPSGKKKLVN